MAKQLTQWRKKGRTSPTTLYNDSTVDYDSGTVRYAGNGETHNSVIKQRTDWSKRVKKLTQFIVNPLAYANRLLYNSHTQYNAHVTYSGIVAGEPKSTAKKPTDWSKA